MFQGTGEKVSIFTYNKKSGNQDLLEHARSTVKRLKTLKHPAILTYLYNYEVGFIQFTFHFTILLIN